jgi:uncharacterized protein (DUF169 family)
MRPLQTDMSIFSKFKFERAPVAVKYLFHRPDGIGRLEKNLALCEMVKEAQQRETPFYITRENESCFGKAFLGMMGEGPELVDGGTLGVKFEIFQEPRANSRLRQLAPHLPRGDVNYVAFSRLDKLTFEPDLLILVTTPAQAEIVLRAMTYSSGELYEARTTCIGGCAWLYVYPFLSGKVNYMVTGLAFGMKGRRVFPEGLLLISIPYQWIQTVTQNLKEMKWVLPGYTLEGEKFRQYEEQILEGLMKECQNP